LAGVQSSSESDAISITSLSGRGFGGSDASFFFFSCFEREGRELDVEDVGLVRLAVNGVRVSRENASSMLCCPLEDRSTGIMAETLGTLG
jgi:hypothetical protein